MQKIFSVEEYMTLAESIRKQRNAKATNCTLFPDTVQRYIDLGRFFYEENDAGIVFYEDEETYYQGYYYLNLELPCGIGPKDKPVCIQHFYAEGRKNPKMLAVEERLGEAGFTKVDEMRQIRGEPEVILAKIRPLVSLAKNLMEKKGYRLCMITEDLEPQVWEILKDEPLLPYYQLSYFSREEIAAQAKEGLFQGIVDENGRLCAARQAFVESNSVYGWAAVRTGYKDYNGWGLVFAEQAMNYAISHQMKPSGWISVTNTHSMKYHEKLGYQFTGRCSDRWLLNGKAGE